MFFEDCVTSDALIGMALKKCDLDLERAAGMIFDPDQTSILEVELNQ